MNGHLLINIDSGNYKSYLPLLNSQKCSFKCTKL